MTCAATQTTVGQLVAERPARSRLFEKLGIDYCCGGKRPIDDVCRERGLDPATVMTMLKAMDAQAGQGNLADPAAMSLTELCDHIEKTHHAYLVQELPRLVAMSAKVAGAHGNRDPRLARVHEAVSTLTEELMSHMAKEEQILFPMIRRIETGTDGRSFHCGSIANPIRQMEAEHDQAGDLLGQLNYLTDHHTPPDWACNTYRALLDGLAQLERDMHQHVHKENNVLFPRAMEIA